MLEYDKRKTRERRNLIEIQTEEELFSGNTMQDGVLQLNKLSRGLFLSWSVNAVILGAGAAKSTEATSGNTTLPLSSPPAHHTLSSLSHTHNTPSTPHISTPSLHLYLFSLDPFPISLFFFLFLFSPAFHMVKASVLCRSILLFTEPSAGTPLCSIVINKNRPLNRTGRGNM